MSMAQRYAGYLEREAFKAATPVKAAVREAVFKYLFICAAVIALVVVTMRWTEVSAAEKLAAQAAQIEQLEYMISACQSTGGFHIDGSWHRCVLREVGK